MKVIAIANLKGGVGKTTSCVNLAYSLTQMGKKILIVDLDPQCNTTRFFAAVNPSGFTVMDALNQPDQIHKAVVRTKYERIHVLRGNEYADLKKPTHAMTKALRQVADQYDVCLIDTRPVFDALTKSGLYAADVILTPIKFDNFCRDNLNLVEHVLDHDEQMPAHEWKIFANMVSRGKAQRQIMCDLLQKHNYPIMESCISRSSVVDNALAMYKPVACHRSKSTIAIDYMELATELIGMDA